MPFVMLFNAFKQFTDSITETRTSMWILLSGNLLNIVGNYVLIYGKAGMPEMGVVGAGVAHSSRALLWWHCSFSFSFRERRCGHIVKVSLV